MFLLIQLKYEIIWTRISQVIRLRNVIILSCWVFEKKWYLFISNTQYKLCHCTHVLNLSFSLIFEDFKFSITPRFIVNINSIKRNWAGNKFYCKCLFITNSKYIFPYHVTFRDLNCEFLEVEIVALPVDLDAWSLYLVYGATPLIFG